MESHKTYQAINPVELAKISQELIVKNKTAYKHLATGLPVQQILDEIIPKLIKLYKGHVVQIVQFETDLSCINLAVLFDDSYTKEMHQAKMGKIHKAINSINDKYGPDTLAVINCNYRDVQDSNKNSSYIYKARNGTVIWEQEPLIRQARRKLAELFPDDYSVYEKWERYKEIYSSAYRNAPNSMDKIIEYWIDTISPYDHGVHHSELVFPLNVLNNTIATGYSKQHLYDIVRIIAPPQSYAIIYLLWQCNPISDEDRLKRAKKDFLERGYTDEDADIIRDYDIGLETLQGWRHDEPERPLSHRMFGANPTINAGALQYLRKNFPDKVDAYETISKGIDLYIQA